MWKHGLRDYDFSAQQAKSILEFAVDKNVDNNLDMSEDLIAAASKVIECENWNQPKFDKIILCLFLVCSSVAWMNHLERS